MREPAEWEINHIDGAQLIPSSSINSGEGLAKLPRDRTPVLYCKTGVRSAEALVAVRRRRVCRCGAPAGRHRGLGAADAARHGDVLIRRAELRVFVSSPGTSLGPIRLTA